MYDTCVKENLGMDRPHWGYHSLPKVHISDRPRPIAEKPAWMDNPKVSSHKSADTIKQCCGAGTGLELKLFEIWNRSRNNKKMLFLFFFTSIGMVILL